MATLTFSRFYSVDTSEHETVKGAAISAIYGIDENTAFPIKIQDADGTVVWENEGDDARDKLEQLAEWVDDDDY